MLIIIVLKCWWGEFHHYHHHYHHIYRKTPCFVVGSLSSLSLLLSSLPYLSIRYYRHYRHHHHHLCSTHPFHYHCNLHTTISLYEALLFSYTEQLILKCVTIFPFNYWLHIVPWNMMITIVWKTLLLYQQRDYWERRRHPHADKHDWFYNNNTAVFSHE